MFLSITIHERWNQEIERLGILFAAFLVLGIALWARFSLLIATIISQSMSPTLEIGDRVLAMRHWPAHWLRKGQIVLFWPPAGYSTPQFEPHSVIPLVKRVVGLPGETAASDVGDDANHEERIILPGHFVVRGDLYAAGADSRTLGNITVPFGNFLAVVVMKLQRQMDEQGGLTAPRLDETRLD